MSERRRARGRAERAARQRAVEAPVWSQALVGIAYITAGALVVVGLGVALAAVVAWVL